MPNHASMTAIKVTAPTRLIPSLPPPRIDALRPLFRSLLPPVPILRTGRRRTRATITTGLFPTRLSVVPACLRPCPAAPCTAAATHRCSPPLCPLLAAYGTHTAHWAASESRDHHRGSVPDPLVVRTGLIAAMTRTENSG